MIRLEAFIYGRVQGVFFRQTTVRQARQLNLTGWVCNQSDGAVAVVAEGEAHALRQFHAYLCQGPPDARVVRVADNWLPATNEFSQFSVRY